MLFSLKNQKWLLSAKPGHLCKQLTYPLNDEVGGVKYKHCNICWGVVLTSTVWLSADSVLLQGSREVRVSSCPSGCVFEGCCTRRLLPVLRLWTCGVVLPERFWCGLHWPCTSCTPAHRAPHTLTLSLLKTLPPTA